MGILAQHLTFRYMPGTPFEKKALNDVSVEINTNEITALIGHTGSGKSTLIQTFNGLIIPEQGEIYINGEKINSKKQLSKIRKKVGLVFQYSEHQLFEETIEKDISFGPKNLGLSKSKIQDNVRRAMEMVSLDYEEYKGRSPFELSGGQKRRVAIAGILAMEPEVLILDEPAAGLDPIGRNKIMSLIRSLKEDHDMTIIMVSHSMEDAADIADRIIVMSEGSIAMEGTPHEVFRRTEELENLQLSSPQITYLMKALKSKGLPISDEIFTVKDAREELLKLINKKTGVEKYEWKS